MIAAAALFSPVLSPLGGGHPFTMPRWTTPEELAWLKGRFDDWSDVKHKKKVAAWLMGTTKEFIDVFPTWKSLPYPKMYIVSIFSLVRYMGFLTTGSQKIKNWFYNHDEESKTPSHEGPSVTLGRKRPRKPTCLTGYQAYSRLFCEKGSALHTKLREQWSAFAKGDKAAIKAYSHLLLNLVPASIKFVTFQQALLKERMPKISEDKRHQVEAFIETCFEEDSNLHDQPWQAMKVDESQTDVDLEKQYNAR